MKRLMSFLHGVISKLRRRRAVFATAKEDMKKGQLVVIIDGYAYKVRHESIALRYVITSEMLE